eukprot:COSAG06_NODE_6245_length_3017_cov_13.349212_2_plen_155_part_01
MTRLMMPASLSQLKSRLVSTKHWWMRPVLSGLQCSTERLMLGPVQNATIRLTSQPAFSALLEAAVNYAEEHDNPDIFLSPTLEAIVQFKWDGRCHVQLHVMYNSLFFAYCIHIVLLRRQIIKSKGEHLRARDYDDREDDGETRGRVYSYAHVTRN